ncbi:MAG: DUF488 family protein [Porphyromonadaceae bacterium]|nr:DUF488 family protein [Porphyromonadaceae bacterium]
MTQIKFKRIYEEKESSDGFRVLADRLWPRGVKKEDADIDYWAKEIAPSNELRKWYHENMNKYDDFYKKFTLELEENPKSQDFVKLIHTKTNVTLLTAAKEIPESQLEILKDFIEKK